MTVSGTATLGESLNISEDNGYSPGTGSSFTILTYTSATGQFANYTGLTLGTSAALQPAYGPTSMTLTTVTDTTIAPDLRVTNLALNPASPQSSQSVTVNWDDINAGNGSTGGNWTDQVVVTNTTTGQTIATAYVPYNAATQGAIAPGGSAAISYTFSLPDGPAGVGTLQVSVTTDYYESIPEYYPGGVGYTNNTTTITAASTLAAYPDLQVTGLAVATPSPESGQDLTIDWYDANTGQAPTAGSWTDQVQVVNTTTGQTLVTADVPYNTTANGSIAAGGTSPQLSYTYLLPDGPAGVGNLSITVTVNVDNTLYEYNGSGTAQSNNTSAIAATSTLAPYPDLQVSSLRFNPSSGVQSGDNLTINWTDANTGDSPTPGSWTDLVVLVDTTTGQTLLDESVPYDPTGSGNGPIAPGGTLDRSISLVLPRGAAGVGVLQATVTTDANSSFYEYNSGGTGQTNNATTAEITSTLATYPDLQVTGLVLSPSSPVSGGKITITWKDADTGDAPVTTSFSDQVTITNTDTGQVLGTGYVSYDASPTGSGPIAAGSSAANAFSFTLPDGAAGAGNLLIAVTTDYGQTVDEFDTDGNPAYSNNTSSINAAATLAPYADLVVTPGSLAVTPAGPQSGTTATVSWTDKNQGDGAATTSWLDYVLVQRVNPDNSLTDVASGFVAASSPLAAGASGGQESFGFSLPDGAAGVGNLRMTVTADDYQSVLEYDADGSPAYANNTSSINATSTLANYADLVVAPGSLAVNPAGPQSGGAVTVTWSDRNQGDGAVNAAFSDDVLVQRANADGSLTLIASGLVPGNASLAAGATGGIQSFSFNLPNGTPGTGDIRVTVTTDHGQTVKEYDAGGNPAYSNNTTTTDVTATLAPSPDLVVQNIVVNGGSSAQVLPNQPIPVSWNDVNPGTAAANGSWIDQVFLASNAVGTQNLQLLATVNVSASLAASGTLPESANITIPATDVGSKYVVVETGLSESFFEFNTANDTSVASSAIAIPPSVQVSLAAPGNATFNKGTVNPASSATVTRNDTNVGNLPVTIASSNPSAVLLSTTPGGVPSATITAVIPDGS